MLLRMDIHLGEIGVAHILHQQPQGVGAPAHQGTRHGIGRIMIFVDNPLHPPAGGLGHQRIAGQHPGYSGGGHAGLLGNLLHGDVLLHGQYPPGEIIGFHYNTMKSLSSIKSYFL